MKKEFPNVRVFCDGAKIHKYGYKASWKVPENAKSLYEAGAMANIVLEAGDAQFNKLNGFKRQLVCVVLPW